MSEPVVRVLLADDHALFAEGLRKLLERLHLSDVTVRSHVGHASDKLGVSNRVELVLYALRARWASLE